MLVFNWVRRALIGCCQLSLFLLVMIIKILQIRVNYLKLVIFMTSLCVCTYVAEFLYFSRFLWKWVETGEERLITQLHSPVSTSQLTKRFSKIKLKKHFTLTLAFSFFMLFFSRLSFPRMGNKRRKRDKIMFPCKRSAHPYPLFCRDRRFFIAAMPSQRGKLSSEYISFET